MFRIILSVFALVVLLSGGVRAEEPVVRLYTLDCGSVTVLDVDIMDDTDSYGGASKELVASCYLIQHGDDYMIWDAGFDPAAIQGAQPSDMFYPRVKKTIAESLMVLGLGPADIGKIGVSHAHFDHIGQANVFKDATLLIGREDYEGVFTTGERLEVFHHAPPLLSEWADGENVIKADGDYDVFGDGSVVMLAMPGHTPGHMALQVTLPKSGVVILSGDLYHFRENFEHGRMPDFNVGRAETLASFERMKKIVAERNARFIIQHDPRDFATMPVFPAYLD